MTEQLTVTLAGDDQIELGGPRLAPKLQTNWRIQTWHRTEGIERLQQLLDESDALITSGFGKHRLRSKRLKLVQIPFAGYDWLDTSLLPSGCVLCNTYEHEIPIAEYVMLGILEWEIGLRKIDADFRAGHWTYCMPPQGPFHGEAYGKTVGLLGYGHIGEAIARRAKAFGLRTMAVARSERSKPELLDWYGYGGDALNRMLAESDYFVITCALTEQTRGLIDAAKLARMKSSTVLINVARGKIVDEQALYAALCDKTIAGAVLDTWYQYPFEPGKDASTRPSAYPFWELDNVIISPHCSAWTRQLLERRWAFVAANLDRLARGEALHNQVPFA